jgi:hypothetical protein
MGDLMETDVLTRLQRLERDNRLLKTSSLGLLVLFFGTCLVAATSTPTIPEEIAARSFKVVGKKSANSAIFAATDDGYVGLFFRDTSNKLRFMTLMTPAGDTTASFTDPKTGKNRLEIGSIPEGSGKDYSLRLLSNDGAELWKPPVRNQVAVETTH